MQKPSQSQFFTKTERFCHGASQNWRPLSPKLATDFLKVGDGFPQSRWRISPKSVTDFLKSVTDFPKIGEGISPKLVTAFLKVGGWFSQSRWLIFPKSVADLVWVADFLKVGDGFFQSRQLISLIDGKLPKRNWQICPKMSVRFSKKKWQIFWIQKIRQPVSRTRRQFSQVHGFRSKAVGYLSGRS